MSFKKILTIILCLVFRNSNAATKYNLIIGASDDLETSSSMFDKHLASMSGYFNSAPSVKYDYILNTQRPSTAEIISKNFSKAINKSELSAKNLDNQINSYIEKIQNGKIKDEDQIALFILGHGYPNSNYSKLPGEVSHAISFFEFKNGIYVESEFYSLDKLQELQKVARKANVKLAIVDSSCRSGNTQKLSDGNTCIITNTSGVQFGNFDPDSFIGNFYRMLLPNKNMEEIFLSAREKSEDNGYPRINTSEDSEVYAQYFNKIIPYMLSTTTSLQKYDNGGMLSYLTEQSDNDQQCKQRLASEEFIQFLNSIENNYIASSKKITIASILGNNNFNKLKGEIKKVQEVQDKAYSLLNSFNKNSEVVSYEYKNKEGNRVQDNFYYKNMILYDFDIYAKFESAKTPVNENQVLMYRALAAKKLDLLKNNNKFKSDYTNFKNISNSFTKLQGSLDYIAVEEKKLYDFLYKSIRKSTQNNPCKGFVL